MEGIVSDLHEYNRTIESRIKAAGFKARVLQVFTAWTEWAVYPKDFLALLRHLFLGGQASLVAKDSVTPAVDNNSSSHGGDDDEDIDGAPLSGDDKEDEEEDLDGVPLDGAALLKSALARRDFGQGPILHSPSSMGKNKKKTSRAVDNDIDGVPMGDEEEYDDDIDGVPLDEDDNEEEEEENKKIASSRVTATGFIPSKWETIAPDQVEAQAITTSKWDTLDTKHSGRSTRKRSYEDDDDEEDEELSGRESEEEDSPRTGARQASGSGQKTQSYDEEKRAKLREVEVQTIKYQDELESGTRSLREGMTMTGQLEQFRQRLMNKSLAELRATTAAAGDTTSERHGSSGHSSSDRLRRSISPDE